MLDVNLLRWRSIQRYRQFSQLMTSVISAVLLALFTIWFLYKSSVDELEYQLSVVQKNVDLLTKIELVPKSQRVTIAELYTYQQQYRKIENIILRHSKAHQLFEVLDKLLPEQVTLTEILYRGDKLWLRGISHSNNDLSDFLIQLSQLTEFQQPQLNLFLQNKDEDLERNNGRSQTNKRFELQVIFLGNTRDRSGSRNESYKGKN